MNKCKLYQVIFLSYLLLSCKGSNQLHDDLEAYAERLSNFTKISLQQELAQNSSNINLGIKDKTSYLRKISPININLREFYAFNDCSLSQLVAQRNTALGKIQLPSSRFLYEIELLNELERCQNQLLRQNKGTELSKGQIELIEKLKTWSALKQQQLPLVWSNVITQSTEIYQHLSKNNGFIRGDSSDNLQETKQALSHLAKIDGQLLLGELPQNLEFLETHLYHLSETPLLAWKWRSQKALSFSLKNTSKLLDEFLQSNTCSNRKQEQDIQIMKNIFNKFFVGTIQGLGGQLDHYHYQLKDSTHSLMQSEHLPEDFKQYIYKHEVLGFKEYQDSMQTHIKLWQTIFARCD